MVQRLKYKEESLVEWENKVAAGSEEDAMYLLEFPTVYVIADGNGKRKQYTVYVGETNDIVRRTEQHFRGDRISRSDFNDLYLAEGSEMYVVANERFNKSLTLDIENRLMQYVTAVDRVVTVNNRRTNPQGRYYTEEFLDETFDAIWKRLNAYDPLLFPPAKKVRDSAIFKASPFNRLTDEQENARQEVLHAVQSQQHGDSSSKLIMVTGEAGSGKTVLISSLFLDLLTGEGDPSVDPDFRNMDAYLVVNHDQQLNVYQDIAKKLGILDSGLDKGKPERVVKATRFINKVDPSAPVDLVLIDEAHLLLTQGNQGYSGTNQMRDILDRARMVVAVYDKKQILETSQYWEPDLFDEVFGQYDVHIELKNQMRMDAAPATVNWVRSIVDDRLIRPFPVPAGTRDSHGYDLRIFADPLEMYEELKKVDAQLAINASNTSEVDLESPVESGLSRMIATFDWPYSSQSHPSDGDAMWMVDVGNLALPWNLQIKKQKNKNEGSSWAEKSYTVDEVGSTFTVQGLDLNYAGVILGPSIKYRGGRVVIDPSSSAHAKATRKRTLQDKTKKSFGDELIANELNVLLTRGVHGMFIYAVDDELREALLRAQSASSDVEAASLD